MSAGAILTQGLGSFGSASHVLTLGYGFDAAPKPPHGGWIAPAVGRSWMASAASRTWIIEIDTGCN